MVHLFDENNQQSILEFTKKLEGRTLREFLSDEDINSIEESIKEKPGNKGKLGHYVEQYFFRRLLNSKSEPDFPCNLELKVTPLKYIKNGELRPKERLVCNIINFVEIVDESWESSSFLKKNKSILLVRYIDPMDKNTNLLDYNIFNVQIFNIFDILNDSKQFKEDWNLIVNKIRNCKAHLLSESDTKYLGACTKGSTALKSFRQQSCGPEAKQRAFSFKTQFMRVLLDRL
jgi:DNA mismatch repair protein MutH